MTAILVSLALILIFLAYMILQIFIAIKPTTGATIGTYPHPRRALLVIDIQEAYTGDNPGKPALFKNVPQFIATVNRVIDEATAQGMLVIYIGHEWPDKPLYRLFARNRAIKGQPDVVQDQRLVRVSPYLFSKSRSDAFSNPELEDLLIAHQVNDVVVVGLDAAGCAYNTAKGALNRGYKATIVLDAVVTMFKKTKEQLAAMYHTAGIAIIESGEFQRTL